jgi:NH3-dependent NAD+ synthetase
MPTKYNSDESYTLAQQLADNLGVTLKIGEISKLVKSFETFGKEKL